METEPRLPIPHTLPAVAETRLQAETLFRADPASAEVRAWLDAAQSLYGQEMTALTARVEGKNPALAAVRGRNFDWYSAMGALVLFGFFFLVTLLIHVLGHGRAETWLLITGIPTAASLGWFVAMSIIKWKNRGRQEALEADITADMQACQKLQDDLVALVACFSLPTEETDTAVSQQKEN